MGRRKARELAIQILYLIAKTDYDIDQGLRIFWNSFSHPDSVRDFTDYLVRGTSDHLEQIDGIIKSTAKNWSFERLTPVDRSILRESIFEILYCPDIPHKVTLNEAIELGKKFGTEKSGGFINGVLDTVVSRKPDIRAGVS